MRLRTIPKHKECKNWVLISTTSGSRVLRKLLQSGWPPKSSIRTDDQSPLAPSATWSCLRESLGRGRFQCSTSQTMLGLVFVTHTPSARPCVRCSAPSCCLVYTFLRSHDPAEVESVHLAWLVVVVVFDVKGGGRKGFFVVN